jgi:hypothetical protein
MLYTIDVKLNTRKLVIPKVKVEIEKDKMQGFFDRLVCQIPLNQRST